MISEKSIKNIPGLSSIGPWKPTDNVNLPDNNSSFENPSTLDAFKIIIQDYWMYCAALLVIVILLIAWILLVFKIYEG